MNDVLKNNLTSISLLKWILNKPNDSRGYWMLWVRQSTFLKKKRSNRIIKICSILNSPVYDKRL